MPLRWPAQRDGNSFPSRRPARINTAGKLVAVRGFQNQLAGFWRLAAMPKDAFAQIRTQLGRSDAGRVTRDEYERAARCCKFAAHFQQRQQVALNLPKFAFG